MLNMIKMDIYRMFRTKSLYVIWIIMAVAVIITTYMSKIDYDAIQEEMNRQQAVVEEEQAEEQVNLGMTVVLPTQPGEMVTVFDLFYANTQAKFIALFLVIFAVIFGTADINSGYIKNIGGQVRNRGHLVLAKMVSLLAYTILSMAGYVLLQVVANQIIFGKIELGNTKEFLLYLGAQTALHYALVIISMALAVVIRSNVISMVIVICLCMNMMMILYSAVDNLIHKAGAKDFQLIEYTVTGKIAMLPMGPTGSECVQAVVIALGFVIVMILAGSAIFRKRDI
ncbi:ABC transporter permease [Bariatricus sp. SGI.154]|uniref:ABC transporter permease n=1 Tax=Bariatricus sp. SGI.154 TaxID=3420549 RepID=UPI003CFFDDDD